MTDTDETDETAYDGRIEVDPDRIVSALATNANISPRDDNRRVVKVWNGRSRWTHRFVQKSAQSHKYPNTRPYFVSLMGFLDTDDKFVTDGYPERRHTVEALDVPPLPEDRTDEQEALIDREYEAIVHEWKELVRQNVGGTIRLVERDTSYDTDADELVVEETTRVIEIVPDTDDAETDSS